MKNQSRILFGALFALIILFTNVSACNSHNNYGADLNNEDVIVIVQGNNYDLDEWENEDRYPLYDYRWGYSYRLSEEYQNDKILRTVYEDNSNYRYGDYGSRYSNDRVVYQDAPNVKYIYSDYMRSYEKIECYNYPPRDKFFYIKC